MTTSATGKTFDRDQVRRFLAAIVDPAVGCTEVRIFRAGFDKSYIVADQRYSKTLGGWYSDARTLEIDLGRLKGVSGYVTVNPVRADLLARVDHQIVSLKRDAGTKDEDIVCLRHLYVDIDPERPADISANDAELALALAKRDEILAAYPEMAASAIWGRSGNGGWILVRLPDYPNDARHRGVVARALAVLADRHGKKGRDPVTIDVTTKNPSRVMAIAGTLKTKGSDRPERPWRLATIDSPWPIDEGEDGAVARHRPLPAFDLAGWVAAQVGGDDVPRGSTDDRPDGMRNGRAHQPTSSQPDPARRLNRAVAYLGAMRPAISGHGGHDQTFDAACALVKGFDLPIADARPILATYNLRCLPPWTAEELEHKLAQADAKPDDKPRGYLHEADRPGWQANGNGRHHANGEHALNGEPLLNGEHAAQEDHRKRPPADARKARPVILCRDVSLSVTTGQALQVLAENNTPPEVFDFGGAFAWIKESPTRQGRAFVEPMSLDSIRNRLADLATFMEVWQTKGGENEVEVFPPNAIVRAVAAQKGWARRVAPPLEMLVESPRFLPGGRLFRTPGYNPEAYIYHHPDAGLDAGEVPDSPGPDAIDGAKSLIFDEYLSDFPFDDQASRANALACMLLPFVRLMIGGPTPLHMFEASTEGTGKGKLANACAFPSIGRELPSTSQKEDEAEWRKTLTSTFQAGATHLYIDNLYNPRSRDGGLEPIDSANLALALTQPEWIDRILGGSKNARIKIQCVWMASGNNVEWSKELARRVVPIRLKTPSENPSERKGFRCEPHTLEEWAALNRNRLLNACLVLCQAWVATGMPDGTARMGSYENYAKTMGGILRAAGVQGFLENRARNTSKDRESSRWPAFIARWAETFGERTVSSNDLYTMIFGGSDSSGRTLVGCMDLQVAFADIVGDKSPLSQKQKLGRSMAKQEDRVYGEYRVVRSTKTSATGNSLYRLAKIEEESAEVTTGSEDKEENDDYIPF